MNSRMFSGASAIFSALAAALSWTIRDYFKVAWMESVFLILAAAAFYYVVAVIVETISILVDVIDTQRSEMARRTIIANDQRLILGEIIRGMSGDQLAVYESLTSAQYDPYDPQSIIIPGFALLTKGFAIGYFATCAGSEMLTPVRSYSEGRSDRQREQAQELLNWLVIEGYVSQWAGPLPARWINKYSSTQAMEKLGLLSPSPTAESGKNA